mmetsp:Transcript_26009/g.41827  ORF Transcript_26009/g.41827 Transcript_26009/m.41827 type:complete len:206 (-) Transcript_26009:1340-1957(-)
MHLPSTRLVPVKEFRHLLATLPLPLRLYEVRLVDVLYHAAEISPSDSKPGVGQLRQPLQALLRSFVNRRETAVVARSTNASLFLLRDLLRQTSLPASMAPVVVTYSRTICATPSAPLSDAGHQEETPCVAWLCLCRHWEYACRMSGSATQATPMSLHPHAGSSQRHDDCARARPMAFVDGRAARCWLVSMPMAAMLAFHANPARQ